jgi:ABC-type Zn uptake system ZnuABC Zn-binding protein ZnuA
VASDAGERLQVATTVSPITSIVSSVAGDRVEVTGIVPEGTNSHTFEPAPSTAELLSTVDVVYINGLQLEEPTRDLAEANMKDGAEIIELGTLALPEDDYIYDFSFPQEGGKPNPHLWTDPGYAVEYAQIVAEDLSERDPDNADFYMDNFTEFSDMVDDFDVAMVEAFATIPEGNKKLLTYHDSFPYFAQNYDWEVIGAIEVENFEEPTPREVAGLIEQVRSEGVPAIFGSEVFPSPVLSQIAKEADVDYVDDLRDDDLPGEPGDLEHSWVGLMRFDYITMTEALGGDASALEAFELPTEAVDDAGYPQ